MPADRTAGFRAAKIMLVGSDPKEILARRFKTAGFEVVKASDEREAMEQMRRGFFQSAVVVSAGSLLNVTETILNLRDLNRTMEIIILVAPFRKHSDRFLRQLLEHPIEGTRIMTRRQLQRQLYMSKRLAPPGGAV